MRSIGAYYTTQKCVYLEQARKVYKCVEQDINSNTKTRNLVMRVEQNGH